MNKGSLTSKEEEILHRLFNRHGIVRYEIVGAVGEGVSLPGSTYPCEIESLSGTVVTPTTAYSFWLDWADNDYSLGEHDGTWRELNSDARMNNYEVVEAQQRLTQ